MIFFSISLLRKIELLALADLMQDTQSLSKERESLLDDGVHKNKRLNFSTNYCRSTLFQKSIAKIVQL